MPSKQSSFILASAALLLAFAWALPLKTALARFMKPDLINIPVARVINNLEAIAAKDSKDAQTRFNLARAHAMAYALKTDTAEVWKGREDQGVWFGYVPSHVPFEVKPTGDESMRRSARAHLASAIRWYEETLKLTPGDLSAQLGRAWCLEQSGNKRMAVRQYRIIVNSAWRKERDMTTAPLNWQSVTAEAAGYLIPLLDPKKDKVEIIALRRRVEKLEHVRRPVTPVAVALRDGLTAREVENLTASVAFDADGTGLKKNWTWISNDAGWLVYDPRGEGKITSALQMFGSVTFWMFWENGYQALAALDDDGDGALRGEELQGLAIWQDLNSNGVSDAGEVKRLAQWGITAISCRYELERKRPGQMAHSQIAYSPYGALFRDGSSRPTYDILLRPALDNLD